MKKLTLVVLAFSFFTAAANAQIITKETVKNSVTVFPRNCGTMQYMQEQMLIDPTLEARWKQLESWTDNWIQNNPGYESKTVITVPVVVHIVYNTAGQNISDARVQEQIDVLNTNYGGLSSGSMESFSSSLKCNTEIQFCLAQRDPDSNATTGIERMQTTVTSFSTNNSVKHYSTGGMDQWDPDVYLNIWVCNLGGGLCGYAEFPVSPLTSTFGLVNHYEFFGCTGAVAPYNLGGTATHEIAHCFNLYHIWGDDGGACSGSDLCTDTPNQASETYGNHSGVLTDACTTSSPGIMYMNFLDYSDDIDYANFTPDQKARMQSCFAPGGPLYALTTSQGGFPPDTCSAQFNLYPDTAILHHYYAVNLATGVPPLSYIWSWGDGTFDSIAYPSHVYDTAGYYNICLTITDSVGCTNSYCDSTYIQKSENTVITIDVIPQGTVGIQENLNNDNFIIYPNPTDNYIVVKNISSYNSENILSIYTMQGQLIFIQSLISKNTFIDVSGFAKGLYFLKIEGAKINQVEKFIKE